MKIRDEELAALMALARRLVLMDDTGYKQLDAIIDSVVDDLIRIRIECNGNEITKFHLHDLQNEASGILTCFELFAMSIDVKLTLQNAATEIDRIVRVIRNYN